MRPLDPAYSQQYLHFLGRAYLLAGKFETAAALLGSGSSWCLGRIFPAELSASTLGHLEWSRGGRVWAELKEI